MVARAVRLAQPSYSAAMGWWTARSRQGPWRPGRSDGPTMEIDRKEVEATCDFVETTRGVEALVEPATSVTTTTIVLIAWDGEWTRRAVPSPKDGLRGGPSSASPSTTSTTPATPNRMRQWNSAKARRRVTGCDPKALAGMPLG